MPSQFINDFSEELYSRSAKTVSVKSSGYCVCILSTWVRSYPVSLWLLGSSYIGSETNLVSSKHIKSLLTALLAFKKG